MRYFLALFLFFNISCASMHSLKKNPSDKELFEHALNLKNRSYYKEALKYFKQLKSQFLYSPLVKSADLAIADIYFRQKEWNKAVLAYGNFYELYPSDLKTDHALFYLALSYFHQLPTTEDRDLTLSKKTLFYLNEHLKKFPKSPFTEQSSQYKNRVLTLLAKKQWMIASFHLKQDRPLSALPYMKDLLKNYATFLPEKKKQSSLPLLKDLKEEINKIKELNKNSM